MYILLYRKSPSLSRIKPDAGHGSGRRTGSIPIPIPKTVMRRAGMSREKHITAIPVSQFLSPCKTAKYEEDEPCDSAEGAFTEDSFSCCPLQGRIREEEVISNLSVLSLLPNDRCFFPIVRYKSVCGFHIGNKLPAFFGTCFFLPYYFETAKKTRLLADNSDLNSVSDSSHCFMYFSAMLILSL